MAARSFNAEICLQGVLTWYNANSKKYVLSGCTTAGIYKIQLLMWPCASDQVEVGIQLKVSSGTFEHC